MLQLCNKQEINDKIMLKISKASNLNIFVIKLINNK